MEFTHIVLVLVDNLKRHILIKSVEFSHFDQYKYVDYDQKESMLITVPNVALARNIRSGLDAAVFNHLKAGLSFTAHDLECLPKLREFGTLYKISVKGVDIKSFADIKQYEHNKIDFIYHSINFFKVYNEVVKQLDDLIEGGAYFEKVKKAGIRSVIHGRNLKILDEIKIPWAYNDGGNVVIDFSGLVEWKSLGVYVSHRQLIELKYFH